MLDRLYSLYVTVIGTIKGYGDYFWADVVEKVDEMGEQVGGAGGTLGRSSTRLRHRLARTNRSHTPTVPAIHPPPPLQVLQYQAQCRKLPKALRDWQAYVDCRDTIDNFLEQLPLFQARAGR
jgi:dynein heavy chain